MSSELEALTEAAGRDYARLSRLVFDLTVAGQEKDARITQLEADLAEAQEVVVKLATHAGHYGNCPLSSWNKRLTKCACGLFQVLSRLTPSPESSEAGQ